MTQQEGYRLGGKEYDKQVKKYQEMIVGPKTQEKG